jgi:hypothetical protein
MSSQVIYSMVKCSECKRVFDLRIKEQAEEFHMGHDCEAP